jgi:hypothetical protein
MANEGDAVSRGGGQVGLVAPGQVPQKGQAAHASQEHALALVVAAQRLTHLEAEL